MILLKFPNLGKALKKNTKDDPANSPYRGIIVLDQKAIVFQEDFCLVVDLFQYFTLDCGIEDDDELDALKGILFYMNGKIFSGEYWNELTKGANMKMNNGSLYVENPRYSKDLHYKNLDIDIIRPLRNLTTIRNLTEGLVGAISIPFGILKTIYDVIPADFKHDHIIFEFHNQDTFVKFTFRKRKHFFGYVYPHYDSAQERYRFSELEYFVDEFQEYFELLKSEAAPPPPPIIKTAMMEVIKNQLDLLDPDGNA